MVETVFTLVESFLPGANLLSMFLALEFAILA